jgi:hypothetical protein
MRRSLRSCPSAIPLQSCALSIYVAFDFFRGRSALGWPSWSLFHIFFPAFVPDVLWNYSLCRLKHIVETPCRNRTPEP